jgi:transcriptional regulator with XRE-family HTH domain
MATTDYEALRLERLRRRYSQFELALQTRIPPRKISAFENGRNVLTPDEVERLRRALCNGGPR